MSIKCPLCDAQIAQEPLKTWNFGKLIVKAYHCDACSKNFRRYEHPNGEEAYTIPKRP